MHRKTKHFFNTHRDKGPLNTENVTAFGTIHGFSMSCMLSYHQIITMHSIVINLYRFRQLLENQGYGERFTYLDVTHIKLLVNSSCEAFL